MGQSSLRQVHLHDPTLSTLATSTGGALHLHLLQRLADNGYGKKEQKEVGDGARNRVDADDFQKEENLEQEDSAIEGILDFGAKDNRAAANKEQARPDDDTGPEATVDQKNSTAGGPAAGQATALAGATDGKEEGPHLSFDV